MTSPQEEAELCHGGTAVRVVRGGREAVVRRCDMVRSLGEVRGPGERLVSAELHDGELVVSTSEGATEALPLERRADPEAELVIHDVRLMTCDGRGDDPLDLQAGSAVIVGGGRVLWHGPSEDAGRAGLDLDRARRLDGGGRLLSPGLVDCHAHPIYAGDRAGEFAMRAAGRSYLEIAEAGGGIMATLGPTREASDAELGALTWGRMQRALASGTTTCEAKSGYDLRVEGELRMLEVAQQIDALGAVDLSPTLLGAHLIAPEYKDDRRAYVRAVAEDMVPAAAERKLATCVDVYCDQNAFTLEETEMILRAAREAGLQLRAHAGQFADLGAAELIAELGGLSADHLEEVSEGGIAAMASAGVVAVMLPSACVQLRQKPPPVEALRAAGVAMAVATDMNPGSTKCEVLPIPMWLATTHYGMTVEEAWLGVTRIAARALGRPDLGVVTTGGPADLVLWDTDEPAAIPYECGRNLVATVLKAGLVASGVV